MHTVTLIRGDGVGPELAEAARRCIDATGVAIQWDEVDAGVDVFATKGTPLPQEVIDSITRNKVALKAPITTPLGSGFRSVNVKLRKDFDLYACLRPCKYYVGVRSLISNAEVIDLVLVRENTEDLYTGIEFPLGSQDVQEIGKAINHCFREDAGLSLKPISVKGSERIIRFAFEYAQKHKRKKVTVVTKSNIMKHTDGLFQRVGERVAKEYPDIEHEHRLIDNMCMQLVQKPELYDVIVTMNLYGDILSDLCAGLVGGLGVAPGANIGNGIAIFEATHGSAPKYTGMNKVNPTALILSGIMMLRYLGEETAAAKLEKAVATVIREGKHVTYDLKDDRNDPTAIGTKEMVDAIIAKLAGTQTSAHYNHASHTL